MHSHDPSKDKAAFREEIRAILAGKSKHHRPTDRFGFTRFVFPEADFRGATFTQDADFLGATFTQDADFGGATFTQGAHFSGATFTQEADFVGATFTQHADFSEARLTRGDFRSVRCSGEARFAATHFSGAAKFPYRSLFKTGFAGAATFYEAMFAGKTYFAANQFDGPVDFARAQFADVALFSSVALPAPKPPEAPPGAGGPEPKEQEEPARILAESPNQQAAPTPPEICFEDIFFERAERVRFDSFDLRRSSFAGTNLRQVRFHNVHWARGGWRRSRVAVYDEIRPNPADPEAVRLLYRDLKASLEDARDWVVAGDFYYGEMEIRRKGDYLKPKAERRSGWRAWLKRWWRRYLSPYTLYWLAGGYGERPLRALAFFAFLVLLFGWLFHHQSFRLDPEVLVLDPPSWAAALGHSLRALTLQRSFYIQPHSDWAHRLTLIASIVGPVQLALLAIALRRRFRR